MSASMSTLKSAISELDRKEKAFLAQTSEKMEGSLGLKLCADHHELYDYYVDNSDVFNRLQATAILFNLTEAERLKFLSEVTPVSIDDDSIGFSVVTNPDYMHTAEEVNFVIQDVDIQISDGKSLITSIESTLTRLNEQKEALIKRKEKLADPTRPTQDAQNELKARLELVQSLMKYNTKLPEEGKAVLMKTIKLLLSC